MKQETIKILNLIGVCCWFKISVFIMITLLLEWIKQDAHMLKNANDNQHKHLEWL